MYHMGCSRSGVLAVRWLLVLLVVLVLAGCGALACAGGEREIVLTRAQLGNDWPLQVNSATVLCGRDGTVLKVGPKRYALDPAAEERGLPSAREIVRDIPVDPDNPEIGAWPADTEPLRAACDATAAVATR